MGEETKLCAMCRKVVDQAALLCPHCRSEINYQYFMEIPEEKVIKERNLTLKIISILVLFVIAFCAAIFGFSIGGIWTGIFIGIVVIGLGDKIVAHGHDKALIACDGCGHSEEYSWPADSFQVGKFVSFDCASCQKRTHLTIQPPKTALSSAVLCG